MKIVHELGGMFEIMCDACGKMFMFPMARCGADSIIWCRHCQHHQPWDQVQKFSDEKEVKNEPTS